MAISHKETIALRKEALLKKTGEFCLEHLDQEYADLSKKMIEKLSRKRSVPFVSGKINIWAAGIVWAIGRINFLGDKSFKPYMRQDELSRLFEASPKSVGPKAKAICDMLKLKYYDEDFSTKKMRDSNPFARMAIDNNGFVHIFSGQEMRDIFG